MTARDDRLPPATRNYVIFGLLFVLSVGLALRDWLDPRERRGATDSALRVLIVREAEAPLLAALSDVDGYNLTWVAPEDAVGWGRQLVDEDAPDYRAAIAYADQHGFGFVALDLRERDWALPDPPPSAARFAVFSVGDVASERPRLHATVLPEGVDVDPALAELDELRRSLSAHPDLTRLWNLEPNPTQLQARQVLDNRELAARRAALEADHAAWAALAAAWPAPLPTDLTGAWERIQAAPIVGGLLVERRGVRLRVDRARRLGLALEPTATLAFVPIAPDAPRVPVDPVAAREPCEGLPAALPAGAEVAVAPDGSAVAIASPANDDRQPPMWVEIYAFAHQGLPGEPCRARKSASFPIGAWPLGRPAASGAMAWGDGDGGLRWWDASGRDHAVTSGLAAASGPWWIGEATLAMIAERPARLADDPRLRGLTELGVEPVVTLLATGSAGAAGSGGAARLELGARELGLPDDPELQLLDLRPAGPRALLLLSSRCPGASAEDLRPCLHRLTSPSPWTELLAAAPAAAPALAIETLGPLPRHRALSIAADGSRLSYVDREQQRAWVVDLHGPAAMVPRALPGDGAQANPRISADGRVVVSEVEVELRVEGASAGTSTLARAVVLDPAPDPDA